MEINTLIEHTGEWVDAAGVALIVLGLIAASGRFATGMVRRETTAYRRYREGLGRTLLLGLEFLVAADIIRTVAITPTFESVGVLVLIVIIRTFLGWTLELELHGQWPWQRRAAPAPQPALDETPRPPDV